MSLWTNWKEFYDLTKDKPPRRLLVEAIPFIKEKSFALDLGAGALNDSKFLLSENFEQVVAVDKEPLATEIANQLPKNRFTYTISSLEDFNFPVETADLVNAQYALPFVRPEVFNEVWQKIERSLKNEGVFNGQLFGDRDEWSGNKKMTFHTKDQALKLMSKFNVLSFEEEEADKATAAGIMKHWHVFHFIVRKR